MGEVPGLWDIITPLKLHISPARELAAGSFVTITGFRSDSVEAWDQPSG